MKQNRYQDKQNQSQQNQQDQSQQNSQNRKNPYPNIERFSCNF